MTAFTKNITIRFVFGWILIVFFGILTAFFHILKQHPDASVENFESSQEDWDALLNLNAQTQELIKTYIDIKNETIKADKIHLGNSTLTPNSLKLVSGWGIHGSKITPPSGTTNDWNIIVSPRTNYGLEETSSSDKIKPPGNVIGVPRTDYGLPEGSEADNALLKFECFASPTTDKSGWTLTGRYKFRTSNGNAEWKTDTKTDYLLVGK